MSDTSLIAIFVSMALINNFILAKFLGLCPFFGVSKNLKNALSMGIAVLFVMLLASLGSWLIYAQILEPLDLEYMKIIVYILVIATLVQIVEMTIKRTNITLYNALGIYLPLITTNCAVLGVAFWNTAESYNLVESLVSALGAGLGFTLVIVIMSGIRERLEVCNVPKPFKGFPIAFLIATILGLSFLGFGGMV